MIREPKTTFNLTAAPQLEENAPQRVLFLGQQLDDVSTDKVLVNNIQPNGQESQLFGRDSMLATMIRAYRKLDTTTPIDAIPYNDNVSGTAATSTVTFVGTATASGTLTLYVQSRINHIFNVGVQVGSTAVELGAQLTTLISADINVGVSATDNSDGTVTLSAINAGVVGNTIGISGIGDVGGISLTWDTFSGGATDPTIVIEDFDQVENIRYQTIVYPASYNKLVIKEFVDSRFNVNNNVLDGVAITTELNDVATLIAEATTLNSQSMVIFGSKPVDRVSYSGGDIFEYAPSISSYVGAIRSLRLTPNINIPNLLIGPLSSANPSGGPKNAAIPYANTPLALLPIITINDGWSNSQRTELNTNGISTLGNNTTNNEIIMGNVVTTYLNNPQGEADGTFKYLNAVDTGSQIREFFVNNNREEFVQSVLTEGTAVTSYQVNVRKFNVFQRALYSTLSLPPYALTAAGTTPSQFFKNSIQTTIDFTSGTVTSIMEVPIVSQLREINGTIRIAFNVQTA